MFLIGIAPAAVCEVLSLTMPESPRFLLAQGRTDEARVIFARLAASSCRRSSSSSAST